MSFNGSPYTTAGLVSGMCADILTRVIDRITREGFNEDDDVADLCTVARALAKLAVEEGVEDENLTTVPAEQDAAHAAFIAGLARR